MSPAPEQRARRVAVIGARGRMGRFSVELLGRSREFEVVAEIQREDDLGVALVESRAELGLDFTAAGVGFEHGRALLQAGIRPVVGTSGVSPAENAELDRLARSVGLGGLVVPNFSLGVVLLQRAALLVAARFAACEIVEQHHERKKDAPSGTALDTAERIAALQGRGPGEVPIHSVRLPGVYARHEVLFGAPGETLLVRHDMAGPEAFGPGILCALRHASRASGVGRGLGVALAET